MKKPGSYNSQQTEAGLRTRKRAWTNNSTTWLTWLVVDQGLRRCPIFGNGMTMSDECTRDSRCEITSRHHLHRPPQAVKQSKLQKQRKRRVTLG
jgi:hypothetical protein